MSGAIRLLPLYTFMTWTGTNLPYSVLLDNVYVTLTNLRLTRFLSGPYYMRTTHLELKQLKGDDRQVSL